MSGTVPWPEWPVNNALNTLKEARDRHQEMLEDPSLNTQVNQGIINALNLGISAVEAIPKITPPYPEPFKVSWNRLVRQGAKNLGSFIHGVADSVESFGSWHFDGCRCEDYYG